MIKLIHIRSDPCFLLDIYFIKMNHGCSWLQIAVVREGVVAVAVVVKDVVVVVVIVVVYIAILKNVLSIPNQFLFIIHSFTFM